MRRTFGLVFGAATQLLFLATVRSLWIFLAGHDARHDSGTEWGNALLALQFAAPHSVLLHPGARRRLSPWIPQPFYGCFFCAVTCLSLLLTFALWHDSDIVVWRFDGAAGVAVEGLWFASWAALFYSLWLTGLGYQTGLTPWWDWVCRRPPRRRSFQPLGAYRFLRHPVYLSFLGLIWFTPVITLDRVTLIAIWTPYIFLGSWLKDARLLRYVGGQYGDYMSRVAGYPIVGLGPLGKVPLKNEAVLPFSTSSRPSAESAAPTASRRAA